MVLYDINGDSHLFLVESFFNHYDALTLGIYRFPRVAVVVV
jgi:hypothetical protein